MKNIILLFLIIFITNLYFTVAKYIDYRDSYLGTYLCTKSCEKLSSNYTKIITINDTLTIEVSKDILDSILNIKIQQNLFKVKLKGKIMNSNSERGVYGGIFFGTDSLSFLISSLHIPNTCTYYGKKKKV